MTTTFRALLAATLTVSSPMGSLGATAVLDPVADASIFQNNVDNGSGGGNGLFVGANTSGFTRRALIAFDIAGEIPQGSIIENVTLIATLGDVPINNALPSVMVGLHRATKSWGEGTTQQQVPPNDVISMMGQGMTATAGDVTWSSRFHGSTPATPWTTPGGDFELSPSASASVGTTIGAVVAWSSQSMVSDVQGWLDDPTDNFGWLCKSGSEATASSLRVFFTSDAATAANWPQLEVSFRVPGDFNGDDLVDGEDLGEWEAQFGSAGDPSADADRDEDVDGADFLVWQRQLGNVPVVATAASVPEPKALVLLLLFGLQRSRRLIPAGARARLVDCNGRPPDAQVLVAQK